MLFGILRKIDRIKHLNREIELIKEHTILLKKYKDVLRENNCHLKFLNEYIDTLPDTEWRRFYLLMNEFGIVRREVKI